MINRIYRAVDQGFDGLVMNPAGFSYAGFALKDCLKGSLPLCLRLRCTSAALPTGTSTACSRDVAEGLITGFERNSYILGL